MWQLGMLGFGAPWVLLALLGLPLVWLMLRALPPMPTRQRFPAVGLLLGLDSRRAESQRMPWWLRALRLLALMAAILGFAQPVLNPQPSPQNTAPLLILFDGSWADAADWPARLARAEALRAEAGRADRAVSIATLTRPPLAGGAEFGPAAGWTGRLAGLRPAPWAPTADLYKSWAGAVRAPVDTVWFSDGLDHAGRDALAQALAAQGRLRILENPLAVTLLGPVDLQDGTLAINATRSRTGPTQTLRITGFGPDPSGAPRALATTDLRFGPSATKASTQLSLPSELRNRITRFQIEGLRSAGAVYLTDGALKSPKIALIIGRGAGEGLDLLSPDYYLRKALAPLGTVMTGNLADLLPTVPDVIFLTDDTRPTLAETNALGRWCKAGGLLVRFAGPRLAMGQDGRSDQNADLLPVPLRQGGRSIGGALSWETPQGLRPFPDESPFAGLSAPDEVRILRQVMAQPAALPRNTPNTTDPSSDIKTDTGRSLALLADGTPLVTARDSGAGQIVLFHVTADPSWSTLPLSGLFEQMLERLLRQANGQPTQIDITPTALWQPQSSLDGFGVLTDASTQPSVPGGALAAGAPGPDLPPGIYAQGAAQLALNLGHAGHTALRPAVWASDLQIGPISATSGPEWPLQPALLGIALVAFMADILASVALLTARKRRMMAGLVGILGFFALIPGPNLAHAQPLPPQEARALRALSQTVLAHVLTGDPRLDQQAQVGLQGLSYTLARRTAIEPGAPIGVDIERDELAFYPFLYWPISAAQPLPSAQAYQRLNSYLRGGGMILFDTRDDDLAGFDGLNATTPTAAQLQSLAQGLDVPPLAPVTEGHVLTRSFYLLQSFPGRFANGLLWAEAQATQPQGSDRTLMSATNDGVSPILIGGGDWAAAWATDALGQPLFPLDQGIGTGGARQREMALRFGVNLIMYVLTGNYKADQVHLPALIERLGQ